MPSKAELKRRGGLVRIRTVDAGRGKYRRVYVVEKPGKNGGHTIYGEIKHKKRSR